MKFIIFILIVLPQLAFSNPRINSLLEDAQNLREFSDEIDDRINYENDKWDASKEEKRNYWRDIVLDPQYNTFVKYKALWKWVDISRESSYSFKDIEALMLLSAENYIRLYNENRSRKYENTEKILEEDHWMNMVELVRMEANNLAIEKKHQKNLQELDKVLKSKIDKKWHWKVLQNE